MILLTMIFAHIVDDFYLQGWLAQAKRRMWWYNGDTPPEPKYKYDWCIALFMHAFSWTFLIMLPIVLLTKVEIGALFYCFFGINVVVHAVIDHLKANVKLTNLVIDQLLHLCQIIVTYLWIVKGGL